MPPSSFLRFHSNKGTESKFTFHNTISKDQIISNPISTPICHSLLDPIIKHLVLFRAHWKHSIKCESILLRPRSELGRTHLYRLKVVIEVYNNFTTFAGFNRVCRSKAAF
jgi:hypothetical protein